MADKANLKFYLTAAEPNLLQIDSSQSLGGYPSSTEYSVSALLSEPMDSVTTGAAIDGPLSSPHSIVVGDEIMKVEETTDLDGEYGSLELLTVARASAGTSVRFHAAGDYVYAIEKNGFFNGSLSKTGKQYRCVAVRNMSDSETFYDLKFYIKSQSRNANCTVKIAVEIPDDELVYSTSTSGTTISITDASLINQYPDNHFVGRLVVIDDPDSNNVGSARIVASFDARTGVLTFKNSFSYAIGANTEYRIEQSSSQRLNSGRTVPASANTLVSSFSTAAGLLNGIGINVNEERANGVDLAPFETVYLWLERDVSSNTDRYDSNRVVFTAAYKNS